MYQGETSSRKNSKHTHLRRRFNEMASGRVRGGIHRGIGKNNSTIASSKVGVPLMIHRRRTSQRRGEIPTPHKPHLSSCTSSCFSQPYGSSQDFSILSLALSSSNLCFVCRAQTFLESVGTVPSPSVLRRQCSERNVVACPHHTRALQCERSPLFAWSQKTYIFTHFCAWRHVPVQRVINKRQSVQCFTRTVAIMA